MPFLTNYPQELVHFTGGTPENKTHPPQCLKQCNTGRKVAKRFNPVTLCQKRSGIRRKLLTQQPVGVPLGQGDDQGVQPLLGPSAQALEPGVVHLLRKVQVHDARPRVTEPDEGGRAAGRETGGQSSNELQSGAHRGPFD